MAVPGSSATTAPAGRHATRPIAPCPQDRGGMWRPAPTSPWRTQHVLPQRYRWRLTAPRQRRTLRKLASSMAHLTICQPPGRCTGIRKGCGSTTAVPECAAMGTASRPVKSLVRLVLGLVGFGPSVHVIPNRMIQACPNPNDGRPAFPLVRGRFVGLPGLEPGTSSLSGIEGSALCGPAFPQVACERQGPRDAFLATSSKRCRQTELRYDLIEGSRMVSRAPAFSRYEAYVRIVVDDPAAPLLAQKQCSPLRGRAE